MRESWIASATMTSNMTRGRLMSGGRKSTGAREVHCHGESLKTGNQKHLIVN